MHPGNSEPARSEIRIQPSRKSARFSEMELEHRLLSTRQEAAFSAVWILVGAWFVLDVTDVRRSIRNNKIDWADPAAARLAWSKAYKEKACRTRPASSASKLLADQLLAVRPPDAKVITEGSARREAAKALDAFDSLQQAIAIDPVARTWTFPW